MHESVYNFITNINELNDINFNSTFDNFVSLIQTVIENHAPLKRQSRKKPQLKNKPWITKRIYTSICRKNKMHKSHYILGDEAMKREYKKYLNKLTKIKSIAKKQYFTDELEKNKKAINEKFGKFCVLCFQEN